LDGLYKPSPDEFHFCPGAGRERPRILPPTRSRRNPQKAGAPPGFVACCREHFEEIETVEDGLGPVFNEASCVNCHDTPIGGTNGRLETRFGKWENALRELQSTLRDASTSCWRRRRNANAHASALPGNTSAPATTARPATALGGANVGSIVDPGMYGGMRPRLKKNHAAA
jgi:hypothetical protein